MKNHFEVIKILKEHGTRKVLKAGFNEIFRKVWRETIKGSYGQDYEDLVVEKLLNYKKNGFYVEIGAYHPVRLSNTYRFYKNGWRGVVVEPNPEISDSFLNKRPRDQFVNKGVGSIDGEMNYFQYSIPALNTFSFKQSKINEKNGYKIYRTKKIKIISVNYFLKKYVNYKKIDFLSLDAEGWDLIILSNWNWKYKPRVICVETENDNSIGSLLKAKKYQVRFCNRANTIYYLSDK